MTTFASKVTRVTVGAYNVLRAGKRREIVVTLKVVAGDDMIEFREKGTRSRWLLPVNDAFTHTVKREAFKAMMANARDRAERKAGRKGGRK